MIRSLILTLLSALSVGLFAQEMTVIKAEGRITYLTVDQVYFDIGSNAGIEVGDTLKVLRRNKEIGLLVVTSIARKSSVARSLVPYDLFQLGDRVMLEKIRKVEVPEIHERKETQFAEKKPIGVRAKPLISQSGLVSLRYSFSQFSDRSADTRTINTIQYGIGLNRPLKVKIWLYGRSNLEEKDFTLYQARADIGKRRSRYFIQLGRVFSSEMPGIGATDGVLFSSAVTPSFSVGALGGIQPEVNTMKFNTDIKKGGFFTKFQYQKKKLKIEGILSLVGQYAYNKIDREFIYSKVGGNLNRKVNFSIYQTVDIYRDKVPYQRSSAEVTSNQISVRFKLYNGISVNTRYSARKQVLYRVTGLSLPDSIFIDEMRSGWFNSIQWSHDAIGSFQAGFNYRSQSENDNKSKYLFLNYRSVLKDRYSWNVSTSFIRNLVITGLRNQLGVNITMKKFGTIYGEYELYTYGYGTSMSDFMQHSITASHNWRLWKKIQGSTTLEYLIDKDYNILYLFLGLTYRI